jgi:Na+/glutamate symporter
MWPFKKKKKASKESHIAKRVIAGLIIGGAIGSIVGKKLMDEHRQANDEEEDSK